MGHIFPITDETACAFSKLHFLRRKSLQKLSIIITRETWSSCFVLFGYMKKMMMMAVMMMKIAKSYWVLAWLFFNPCYTIWILGLTCHFLRKTWNFHQNFIECIDLFKGDCYIGDIESSLNKHILNLFRHYFIIFCKVLLFSL